MYYDRVCSDDDTFNADVKFEYRPTGELPGNRKFLGSVFPVVPTNSIRFTTNNMRFTGGSTGFTTMIPTENNTNPSMTRTYNPAFQSNVPNSFNASQYRPHEGLCENNYQNLRNTGNYDAIERPGVNFSNTRKPLGTTIRDTQKIGGSFESIGIHTTNFRNTGGSDGDLENAQTVGGQFVNDGSLSGNRERTGRPGGDYETTGRSEDTPDNIPGTEDSIRNKGKPVFPTTLYFNYSNTDSFFKTAFHSEQETFFDRSNTTPDKSEHISPRVHGVSHPHGVKIPINRGREPDTGVLNFRSNDLYDSRKPGIVSSLNERK